MILFHPQWLEVVIWHVSENSVSRSHVENGKRSRGFKRKRFLPTGGRVTPSSLKRMKNDSQNQTILMHLIYIGPITSMDAFEKYRITRLSGRIYNLRHDYHIDIVNTGDEYAVYQLGGTE